MKRVRWLALVAVLALIVTACAEEGAGDTTTTAGGEATTTAAPEATTTSADAGTSFEGLTLESGGCGRDLGFARPNGDPATYDGKIDSIAATAANEVVFTLCSQDPAFLAKIAFIPFGVHPAEHLEATEGAPLENPVGTGPFMLPEGGWARGSEIVYQANPDYWGEVPAFDTLVFRWRDSSTARITEITSGNADFITNLAASDYATIEGDSNLVLLPDLNPNVFYVGFNVNYPPFDNVQVRQAVAMGVDRQRIIDTFYPSGSEVATHFTPCIIENACEGEPFYEFDPEGARALLAEAGFPDGFDTTIKLRDVFRVYLPEPTAVAEDIRAQLAENLGINATIEVMESGAFLEENAAGTQQGIHLLGWGADYPHVTNFLDFHFGGGNIQFGDPFPEIVDVLAEGARTTDPAAAQPIYEEANNLLRENVPMFPVAWGAAADAALTTVENAQVPPVGAPQFATMNPGDADLVFVQNAEPISLYCPDETDGESLSACEQVMESLYGYGLDGGVVPKLATECAPDESGLVWTCTLREGVTFHDGSTFDANDVVTTWSVGLDATNPLHTGNSGVFQYFSYLWGGLINEQAPAES
ncbi:MAG: ABC transporter substrate-binding protein [Acidimicrobiia bacterium]